MLKMAALLEKGARMSAILKMALNMLKVAAILNHVAPL